MYSHNMEGWDWLWGTLMMSFWVILIGVVVYIAVKLAQGEHGRRS